LNARWIEYTSEDAQNKRKREEAEESVENIQVIGIIKKKMADATKHIRFTPNFSEASYTTITDGVMRSRSGKHIRAIRGQKPVQGRVGDSAEALG
jgi:hypothetical protein